MRSSSWRTCYGYGPHDGPLTESTSDAADHPQGPGPRRDVGVAPDGVEHAASCRWPSSRASDFVGPGVRGSAFGNRFFDPLRVGKPAQTAGNVDVPHSVTYVPDLAEALVRVAEDDRSWGRAWHAPVRAGGHPTPVGRARGGIDRP